MIGLYPVRPGQHNDELRFSLRSLQNLPEVDEVWIVGHHPAWCQPDRFIPGNQWPTGQANVYRNILAGCQAAAAAGHHELIVLNDDFYITETVEQLPALYRGTLAGHVSLPALKGRTDWWPRSLRVTEAILQAAGVAEPLSWELHVPLRVNPALMADILGRFELVTPDNPPQWRSLYGNLAGLDGEQSPADYKQYGTRGQVTVPFCSTIDDDFHAYFVPLRNRFPTPSRWETP